MKNENEKRFEGELSPGNPLELKLRDGSTLEARMEYDEDGMLPWENGDCHGVVSDWRRYERRNGETYKAPGERVLCTDRGSARFYDVTATMEKQKTVWGEPTPRDGETQKQANARVIDADFEFLRAFCEDRWSYYGVVLKHTTADGYEKDHVASLWGIEYGDKCDDSYPTTVANDLLAEFDGDLSQCDHDSSEDCMNCTDCGRCSESLDCQDRCTDCGGHDCETKHPGIDEEETA
jgi:hypothetical protein